MTADGPTLLTFRAGTVWDVSSNYISLDQAAERLGVNPRTIRGYIAAGDLPAYRLGKRLIRVRPEDIDALLRRIPTAGQWPV